MRFDIFARRVETEFKFEFSQSFKSKFFVVIDQCSLKQNLIDTSFTKVEYYNLQKLFSSWNIFRTD